ncbi:hypothetical protein CsSME_00008707 [Camellia sinensis var. sinensis]
MFFHPPPFCDFLTFFQWLWASFSPKPYLLLLTKAPKTLSLSLSLC